MLRLNPSALERDLPSGSRILLSTELALKRPPADSKTLKGRSWQLIQFSFMRSEALIRFLLSISMSFEMMFLASLDIISGHLN